MLVLVDVHNLLYTFHLRDNLLRQFNGITWELFLCAFAPSLTKKSLKLKSLNSATFSLVFVIKFPKIHGFVTFVQKRVSCWRLLKTKFLQCNLVIHNLWLWLWKWYLDFSHCGLNSFKMTLLFWWLDKNNTKSCKKCRVVHLTVQYIQTQDCDRNFASFGKISHWPPMFCVRAAAAPTEFTWANTTWRTTTRPAPSPSAPLRSSSTRTGTPTESCQYFSC